MIPSSINPSDSRAAGAPSIADMQEAVSALLANGKGILAADESLPSIGRLFALHHIESTEENRRMYRTLLFSSPELGRRISGVILFEETLRQRMNDGTPVPMYLRRCGMVPGIKVDRGLLPFTGMDGEQRTEGLGGLQERLEEYRRSGARFTKWRSVLRVGNGLPSDACIRENAGGLASFALWSQEAGLVPLVEPEVLMDGDHSLEECEAGTTRVLKGVFAALAERGVNLQRLILKTGMVVSGRTCLNQASDLLVTEATLRCLGRAVPAAVPGIVFLSGGQGEVEATRRLDGICRANTGPWKLTFSFGRALQSTAMRVWGGRQENIAAAQQALLLRADWNGLATEGRYSTLMERERLGSLPSRKH